jgi:hypothetical protein
MYCVFNPKSGAGCHTITSLSGCGKGRFRRRIEYRTLKIALVAPIPSATATIATCG